MIKVTYFRQLLKKWPKLQNSNEYNNSRYHTSDLLRHNCVFINTCLHTFVCVQCFWLFQLIPVFSPQCSPGQDCETWRRWQSNTERIHQLCYWAPKLPIPAEKNIKVFRNCKSKYSLTYLTSFQKMFEMVVCRCLFSIYSEVSTAYVCLPDCCLLYIHVWEQKSFPEKC